MTLQQLHTMMIFPTILLFVSAALVYHADAAANDSFGAVEQVANRPPSLKPLTPIAGTNLHLNLPYKWHDRRPGCYTTKINDDGENWVVCTKVDQKWYYTPDSSWIFERNQGSEESMNDYHGSLKIRNLANRNIILNSLPFAEDIYLALERFDKSLLWRDSWTVRTDPSDNNNMALEPSGFDYYVSQVEGNRNQLWLINGKSSVYPYSFVPEIQLEANMYHFHFTEPPFGAINAATSKKDLMDSYEINNNSPASLTRVITVSQKITNEFSWGLSESFKTFAKVKGKASIPFIASTEVETGFEMTLSSTQNWKSSEEKTFTMSYTANVPPYSTVKISAWYDLTKDISMDYTSETEITGKGTRMTVFDEVIEDSPVTGEMIAKYLGYTKFDGTVVQIKENSVITRIKGTMVASLGLRGQLNVDGQPVTQDIIPK